jgi:hypothetical protein
MIAPILSEQLDIVSELKLRQWARRNYVIPELRRDEDWHQVVIDEMRLRDSELDSIEPLHTVVTSTGIVPLELSRHNRFDTAHMETRSPHIGQEVGANLSPAIPHYG